MPKGDDFVGGYIDVSGKEFFGCFFKGCVLFSDKSKGGRIENCQLVDCLLAGDGWPEEMDRGNKKLHIIQ